MPQLLITCIIKLKWMHIYPVWQPGVKSIIENGKPILHLLYNVYAR